MLLFRAFNTRRLFQTHRIIRKMSLVNVKCSEGDERLQISFAYAHNGGFERTFNAERLKKENVEVTRTRLGENISKKVIKKKKKRKNQEEEPENEEIKVSILAEDGVTEVDASSTIQTALQHGNIVTINNLRYTVNVNPPNCLKAVISDSVMVGFPQFPELDLEFADLNDCEFLWFKVQVQDDDKSDPNDQNKQMSEAEKHELSTELSYTPTNDDIGYRLGFSVTPKYGSRRGNTVTVQSKYDVTAGPGFCPFENRQQYTQRVTDIGEFRVISYNILADLYASQEYSREVLFNYCPPYALDFDYRKHLLLGELKGYNGDILCLQEVDKKFFENGLLFAMDTLGLDGAFLEKGISTKEGSAIFYRKSKFRLIEEHRNVIKDILETDSACQDLIKKTYCVPALKEKLETRTTVLHVLVLEPVERPGQVLIVANTHLYFHPDAGHIRLIQMLTAMRFIETLMNKYKKQKPSLVFCGDFNSTPHRGIYEYMTTKQIKEDNIDWNNGGEEQFAAGMNFSHNRNFASGCGLQAYTNYTPAFNGQLDYVYYDLDLLEVVQVIPPPDHRDVELHSGLPSIAFPSDHIAQICDFKWK